MRKRKAKPYRGKGRNEAAGWLTAAAVLAVTGFCAFALFPGVRFSGTLALCLAGVCLLGAALERWAAESRRGRLCRRVFLALLCAGAVAFGCVEGLLLSRGGADNSALPAEAAIVLGAGVNGETPSLILQSRIEAAADYLTRHPDTLAILSGGQGDGERISEAECMRRELVKRGIPEERLILEDRSTSTAENFACSRELLEERGLAGTTVAVITSDFHCFRSHLIARRAGLSVMDIPAKSPYALLNANYYVREAFALCKTLIFD
ncbi:YdcF family protein [Dysosmobacter sp.]|uniref:YdcF family protein n=1 Tax=Dysosmobacter sp. TaxID=2591382 RepID=UPI002A8A4180|nr:YdcF family protein [Dysosmobacter sp.]MDY3281510.1 YdcF family protein [Dysosmobacter sp.]